MPPRRGLSSVMSWGHPCQLCLEPFPCGFVTCGASLRASSILPVLITSHNDVTLLSPRCTPTPDLDVPGAVPCVPDPCCGCPGSCFRLVHLRVTSGPASAQLHSAITDPGPLSPSLETRDKHLPEPGGAELCHSGTWGICQLSPQISALGGRAPFPPSLFPSTSGCCLAN